MIAARRILVAMVPLVFVGAGCAYLKPKAPDVALRKVDLQSVDFQRAGLQAHLDVTNKLPVPITVGKVNWKVEIDGSHLVGGSIPKQLSVPAEGKAPVQIPFTLKFDDLYRIAGKYKDQDEAPFKLLGDLQIDTPLGPFTVPFTHVGKVPVLKVPAVDLSKVELKGLSFDGASVRLGFNIKNPNKIPLDLQGLDYALTLAGAKVAEGGLPQPIAVAAHGEGSFAADVKISFTQAQAAVTAIRNASTADYSIGGKLRAKTPWGEVAAPYSRTGTVRILK